MSVDLELNNDCAFCSNPQFDSYEGVSYGVELMANEVNSYISCLRNEMTFKNGFIGKNLQHALNLSASSRVSPKNSPAEKAKTLAFTLLISLPTTLFIWDIHKTMNYKCTEFTSTFEAATVVSKKVVYTAGFCALAKVLGE